MFESIERIVEKEAGKIRRLAAKHAIRDSFVFLYLERRLMLEISYPIDDGDRYFIRRVPLDHLAIECAEMQGDEILVAEKLERLATRLRRKVTPNAELRGRPLAGEASSREAATSTVVLGNNVEQTMKQRDKEIVLSILAGSTREEAARMNSVTPVRAGQIFSKVIHAIAPEIARSIDEAAGGKKNGPMCFISQARARADELIELVHNAIGEGPGAASCARSLSTDGLCLRRTTLKENDHGKDSRRPTN